MAVWTNNAEGGTDGAAVTAANSGGASGDPLVNATVDGTNSFIRYAAANALLESMAYQMDVPTSGHAYLQFGNLQTNAYGRLRFHMIMTAYPSATKQFIQTVHSPAGPVYLYMNAVGKMSVINAAGTTVYTFANAIPLNTRVRIEVIVKIGTTTANGTVKAAWAYGNDVAYVEQYSSSALNTGPTGTFVRYNVGSVSSSGIWRNFYIDDITVDDDTSLTFMGPSTTEFLADIEMDAVAGMSVDAVRETMSVVGFGVSSSMTIDAVRQQFAVLPMTAAPRAVVSGVNSRVSVLPVAGVGTLAIKTSPIGNLLMGALSEFTVEDAAGVKFSIWKASVVPAASLAGMFAQQGAIVLAGSSQAIWGPLRTQPAVLAMRGTPTFAPRPGVVATVLVRVTPALVLNSQQSYLRTVLAAVLPRMVISSVKVVGDIHPSERVLSVILGGSFSAILDLLSADAELLGDGEGLATITRGSF